MEGFTTFKQLLLKQGQAEGSLHQTSKAELPRIVNITETKPPESSGTEGVLTEKYQTLLMNRFITKLLIGNGSRLGKPELGAYLQQNLLP